MRVIETLKASDTGHRLALLHFHLGSQISEIPQLRQAARELAHIYAELIGLGLPVRYLDVGGGLGVNYTDASEDGGIRYSLTEYANAVVYAIKDVCDERGVPHPVLVSESGRAITAHHSVLVVEALDAFRKDNADVDQALPEDAHRITHNLGKTLAWLRNQAVGEAGLSEVIEAYHDVVDVQEEAATLFSMGYLPLEQNAIIERMYWSSCAAVLRHLRALEPEHAPPEVQQLEELLVDQYLVDFSVFQSMLDHWAIQQPFPIVPLDRLDEFPSRRGMLVDLTCDSDGKVSQYVSAEEDRKFLRLHPLNPGEAYPIGIFLMGAYQDIMGDTHNLFGRVTEAHVYGDAEEEGNFWIEKVIPGQKVEDMLAKVQYFPNDLQRRMQDQVKQKIDSGAIRPKRGMAILDQYRATFGEETYLLNSRLPRQQPEPEPGQDPNQDPQQDKE
jgi:arginine decarboxylase